ncbi:MAG: endoglucanase [Candidatus Adlerbacteria bacterium]|nr:endoglucanase [Candidatus Adlerbacteria bacterium]
MRTIAGTIAAGELHNPVYTLDFAGGVNTGIVSVARNDALACATYWDASGVLRTAAANVLRLDHDPKTGENLGALIEESRINRLLYSNDYSQAWWTKTNSSLGTAIAGPDGTAGSFRLLLDDATNGDHLLASTSVAITAGHIICATLLIKPKEHAVVRVRIANAAGTNYVEDWFDCTRQIFGMPTAGGTGWAMSEHSYREGPNGSFILYFRVTTATDTTAVLSFGGVPSLETTTFAGNAASGMYFFHAELQSGSGINLCPSLIVTTGAARTRLADRVTHAMSVVPGYDGPQGSMTVKYRNIVRTASSQIINLALSGNTTKGQVGLVLAANSNQAETAIRNASDAVATAINARAGVFDDWNVAGVSWVSGRHEMALNGAAASPGPLLSAIVPPSTGAPTAYLGHARTAATDTLMLNGWIAAIKYWIIPLTTSGLRRETSRLFNYSQIPGTFRNGVNCAGLEYTSTAQPGTHNVDYFDTRQASFSYYASKIPGGVVRVPYRWDRAQPALGGALDEAYCALLDAACAQAHTAGMEVILDCHNYSQYRGSLGGSFRIGAADNTVTVAHFVDFYDRMAQRYAGVDGFLGFDLMNEPGLVDKFTHARMMQRAIDAVRTHDTDCYLFIEAPFATPTTTFPYDNRACYLNDPSSKLVYSAHHYYDNPASGVYAGSFAAELAYPMRARDRLVPFLRYLLSKNARGHIGETGFPATEEWPAIAYNFAALCKQANLMMSWWQAGRAVSGTDPLSLEPADINSPVDRVHWATISHFQ